MKIVITPETDEEKRNMPEDATTFEGVDRHILIMGEKFTMTGNPAMLRSDVGQLVHYFDKMQTVEAVHQAMKQMATHAQVVNGPAAQIGKRIIQGRQGQT